MASVDRTCEILNELGLHARPATKFVRIATKFSCDVELEKDGQRVNGKSIMGVLMLVAGKGTKVTVHATGEDAQQCVESLAALIANRFEEDK